MRSLLLFALLLTATLGCRADDTAAPAAAPQETTLAAGAPGDSLDPKTAKTFNEIMRYAQQERLSERPLGEIMQAVGLRLRKTPYVAGMLDEPSSETLICRLDGFDCVTFVETTLALARGIKAQDYSVASFKNHIQDQRYRGGRLDGYCSRLHYFSEWIMDNEERGNVRNISEEVGGERLAKKIDFMTANREKYPRFAKDEATFECVREMEARLEGFDFYYLPQNSIRSAYDELQAGDIVATATSVGGLDVTHSGLVYDDGEGGKGFLHASPTGGVKVSPDLQDYIKSNKSQIGIVVVRPIAE